MKKQTIIWTALPNGFMEDGRLRLSAHAAFRLSKTAGMPPLTLQDFPDLLSENGGDWPTAVREAEIKVHYGGQTWPANILEPLPSAELWRALFDLTTYVRPFVYDRLKLSDKPIVSYPLKNMEKWLKQYYQALIKEADDKVVGPHYLTSNILKVFAEEPGAGNLFEIFEEGREKDRLLAKLKEKKKEWQQTGAYEPGTTDLFEDFILSQLFFLHPGAQEEMRTEITEENSFLCKEELAIWMAAQKVPLPDEEDFAELIDFHQRVAALNQYKDLLRQLGIVIDLAVDLPQVPVPPTGLLSVEVNWLALPQAESDVETVNLSMATETRLQRGTFRARPDPMRNELKDGLLRLNKSEFGLVQVDVDGLALKLWNTWGNAFKLQNVVTDEEEEMGAPSARTGGLTLVREGNAKKMADHLRIRSQAINQAIELGQPASMPLFADDLVRGYRVDVWDNHTNLWRSLCERIGEYEIEVPDSPLEIEDEGLVQAGLGLPADHETNPEGDQAYLHEAMVDWKGWSLVAPRPGRSILPEDETGDAKNQAVADLNLSVNFDAKTGSLPRLRFGRNYRLRARAVDLAGNSLPPSVETIGDGTLVSDSQGYWRFEPVPSPMVALVEDNGEFSEVGPGESMLRLAVRTTDEGLTTPSASRFLLPPRVTQHTAEVHGKFDLGTGLDKAAYLKILAMDKTLEVVPVDNAQPPGASQDKNVFLSLSDPSMPYLPDPFAHDVVIQWLDRKKQPIGNAGFGPIPFYVTQVWPDAEPFRIVLQEGNGLPQISPTNNRILNLFLPQAGVAYLRISAKIEVEEMEQMGLWQWRRELGDPSTEEEIRAENGRNWLLTPWKDIALVHAVQRPLVKPDIKDGYYVDREKDRTFVRPRFDCPVDRPSTDKVDMLGKWNEPQDAPDKGDPSNIEREEHAFEHKVKLDFDNEEQNNLPFMEFPETHELGTTGYRKINYWLEATTRFREYMDPDLEASDLKRVSTRKQFYVPNCSRPQAPDVLYVVPTFGWDKKEEESGVITSTRKGGGLRVYLNRPWYSSGYGEMLAIVLRGSYTGQALLDPKANDPEALKPYITQWGSDPIWASTPLPDLFPRRDHFPGARINPQVDVERFKKMQPAVPEDDFVVSDLPFDEVNLTLPGLPGVYFDIAPHDVGWDDERKLWYCDIEVDTGLAYYPFIRLALARYHPQSIGDAHLSRVVLADFAQLTPDRSASVIPVTDNPRARRVTLSGPIHSGSSIINSRRGQFIGPEPNIPDGWFNNIIELTVERLDPALGDDFGWQEVNASVSTPPFRAFGEPLLLNRVVELPEDPQPGERYRIVISEYELFQPDEEQDINGVRRLVYVDHLPL